CRQFPSQGLTNGLQMGKPLTPTGEASAERLSRPEGERVGVRDLRRPYAALFIAASTAFFGLTSVRRPSAVFSAVSRITAMTSVGLTAGLTARILPARFATCGEA